MNNGTRPTAKRFYTTITAKIGSGQRYNDYGKGFDNPKNFDAAALSTAAAGADVINLCLGENAYAESPGNIADLALE
jgi:beta-glucosidase